MGQYSQDISGWLAGTSLLLSGGARGNYQVSLQDVQVLVDGVPLTTITPKGVSYATQTQYFTYSTPAFNVPTGLIPSHLQG